jgi:hypothetical protein
MIKIPSLAAFAVLLLVSACAPDARAPFEPAPVAETAGPAVALQALLAAELGTSTVAEQIVLQEEGDWAWMIVQPRAADGGDIDWSATPYALDEAEGVLDQDGRTYALLKRQNGVWTVLEHVVGPTDVSWQPWAETHGAPASLIVLPVD